MIQITCDACFMIMKENESCKVSDEFKHHLLNDICPKCRNKMNSELSKYSIMIARHKATGRKNIVSNFLNKTRPRRSDE